MRIPFTKAHGARNDFLLTWAHEAPRDRLAEAAVAICDRHTGVGADGWLLVSPPAAGRAAAIRLFNPDGGEVEMSGNGTRCAAAFLIDAGLAESQLEIQTGGGLKRLRMLRRDGERFEFEMNMGRAAVEEERATVQGWDATILNVGNPQCAVFVSDFGFDWRTAGMAIERDSRFPNRTNVSFVRVVDGHTIEVRFWERGAGETMSSGTGSTGAMAAAAARGEVRSPVRVETPAGPLELREEDGEILLVGPAEIVAAGEFYA
ncbi:MAG: diaminopimelate epimerase [Bryobacteraceae bacterium]|nr:diaminopimelate epimerase [Bryobacteraceae bacterium]